MKVLERTALLEVPAPTAYGVVVDVIQYPEFVPGCEHVEILQHNEDGIVAAVSVAGKGIRESFVTANIQQPPQSVTMSLQQGPFEHLEGRWTFTPLGDIGCRVDLRIEYLPKGVLVRLLGGLADSVANRLVDAFSERITRLHENMRESRQPAPGR